MIWPFENDTSAITKKLAKKSLQSEKRRDLMVVIAVALAAFLICFTGIVSNSLAQMQRKKDNTDRHSTINVDSINISVICWV